MYCGIYPDELETLLNYDDILDIESHKVDTSPAKPHVLAKKPVNVNPNKPTVRTFIDAKPKVPKPDVRTFIGPRPKLSKSIVKPMPTDTNKVKGQTSTYKSSMSDLVSYQLIPTKLVWCFMFISLITLCCHNRWKYWYHQEKRPSMLKFQKDRVIDLGLW